MQPKEIRDLAITTLEEMKGINIIILDVTTLTTITDFMIMCTGRSTRHVQGLAESVALKAKEMKVPTVRTEGNRDSEWVLVDLGDVIVHVMIESTRAFYNLENLWEPIKELREKTK